MAYLGLPEKKSIITEVAFLFWQFSVQTTANNTKAADVAGKTNI
jgi:hypothetical protein